MKENKYRLLFGLFLILLIVSGSLISLYTVNIHNQSSEITFSKASNQSGGGFGEIKVYMAGAVVKSGVYTIPKGSRLEDALALAGGVGEEADKKYIETNLNLAARLSDGEKIYLPTFEETQAISETPPQAPAAPAPVLGSQTEEFQTEININTATVEQLLNANLYRIGPKTAEKIVTYREENGLFTNISEIMNVKGIGEMTFANIKDRISVN